jgi:hypothetical protein
MREGIPEGPGPLVEVAMLVAYEREIELSTESRKKFRLSVSVVDTSIETTVLPTMPLDDDGRAEAMTNEGGGFAQ